MLLCSSIHACKVNNKSIPYLAKICGTPNDTREMVVASRQRDCLLAIFLEDLPRITVLYHSSFISNLKDGVHL